MGQPLNYFLQNDLVKVSGREYRHLDSEKCPVVKHFKTTLVV